MGFSEYDQNEILSQEHLCKDWQAFNYKVSKPVFHLKEVIKTSVFMFPLYIGILNDDIQVGVQHVPGTVLGAEHKSLYFTSQLICNEAANTIN